MTRANEGSVIISCRDVRKSFGDVRAVDGASFDVRGGELLAVLGPSGCGKTTLLRLIAGFERVDDGQIEIAEKVVSSPTKHHAPEKRHVGVVFQDLALFPHLTVAQNVGFGVRGRRQRSDRVKKMLELTRLSALADRLPHELSGGQQQRVALARALAPEPRVVLLDEPFSSLDASLRQLVRSEVVKILKSCGATAVWVTHDQEEAFSLADRVALMVRGSIAQVGPPEEIYRRPASAELAPLLGEANIIPGRVQTDLVQCDIGVCPYDGHAADGECCDVLIRPEWIQLHVPEGARGQRALGVVVRSEFYGHDQAVIVKTLTGREVRVRVDANAKVKVGQQVELSVNQAAVVYPESPASSQE